MCGKLAERGPKHIVVTGIHFNQTQIANFIYNKGEDFQIVMVDRIGGDRSGTGDVIAAIIVRHVSERPQPVRVGEKGGRITYRNASATAKKTK